MLDQVGLGGIPGHWRHLLAVPFRPVGGGHQLLLELLVLHLLIVHCFGEFVDSVNQLLLIVHPVVVFFVLLQGELEVPLKIVIVFGDGLNSRFEQSNMAIVVAHLLHG